MTDASRDYALTVPVIEYEHTRAWDTDGPLEIPALVLVLRGYRPERMTLSAARPWKHLQHQSAGIACNQVRVTGLPLTPRPAMRAAMEEIGRTWDASNVGCFGVALADAIAYRDQLHRLTGADCQYSWTRFQEAYYPIDCSSGNDVRALCTDDIPDDLDDLVTFASPFDRLAGFIGRWELAILTENSD